MTATRNRYHVIGVVVGVALLATLTAGQTQTLGGSAVALPEQASALEGTPTVRVEITSDGTKRQELDQQRAAAEALKIEIVNGRYYWKSRENRPLTLTTSGDFIYLTSAEPGKYIRIRTIKNRLSYVEHVDMELGSVTYWGELRVVLGK